MNHPLLLVLLTAASLYVAKLWRTDQQAAGMGRPHPRGLPGATAAPRRAILLAMGGTLVVLGLETVGEIALGVAVEQSRMTWLFALYSVCAAPVIEELVFRGWLVVEKRGRAAMWAGAILASGAFALLHPFLWRWDDTGFELMLGVKGCFSTAMVFAMSLWLYVVRLAAWNPSRSLLPCFAGHAAKNVGVVAIKAATGYMAGLW